MSNASVSGQILLVATLIAAMGVAAMSPLPATSRPNAPAQSIITVASN